MKKIIIAFPTIILCYPSLYAAQSAITEANGYACFNSFRSRGIDFRMRLLFCRRGMYAGILLGFLFLASVTTAQELKPELFAQVGHPVDVKTITFAPNGRWLATGGLEGTVRIWDGQTAAELRVLSGPTGSIQAVAISPDSQLVAAASGDKTIYVWEVDTGRCLGTWTEKSARKGKPSTAAKPKSKTEEVLDKLYPDLYGDIKALAFSTDGKLLLGAGNSKKIHFWDPMKGSEVRSFEAHEGTINALAVGPNNQWVASGSEDKTIVIWDLATGRRLRTLQNNGQIWSLAVSPDSKLLASVSWKPTGPRDPVLVWDVQSGQQLQSFGEKGIQFFSVRFAPDGRRLAAFSFENKIGSLSVWDLQSLQLLFRHEFGSAPGPFAYNHIGDLIAIRGDKGGLLLINAANGDVLRESLSVTGVSKMVAERGSQRILGYFGARIIIWDASVGGVVRTIDLPSSNPAFSSTEHWIASGSEDGEVTIAEPNTGDILLRTRLHQKAADRFAVDPEGRWLASGSFDKTLRVLDIRSGQQLFSVENIGLALPYLRGITFSSDGRILAAEGNLQGKKAVFLWSVPEGKMLKSFPKKHLVYNLAFSPDGTLLAVLEDFYVGAKRMVKVWRISDGKLIRSLALEKGGSGNNGLAFSSDGKRLAAASSDNKVYIWEVSSGREVLVLRGHEGSLQDLLFYRNDQFLLTSSSDGSIRIWDAGTGECLLALYSLQNTLDWIVVTPDGLFDGSPNAWRRLMWRFGGKTFDLAPLELFFNEFFYPGLLGDILQGKRPKAPRNLASLDRRQPAVTLLLEKQPSTAEISDRQVEVAIEVQGAASDSTHPSPSGVKDLRLFRNGSLVKRWHGKILSGSEKRIMLKTSVTLLAGENRLIAYAFNEDNIKSPDASLTLTGAKSLARPGTAYILAVGVNEYSNQQYNLRFAAPDARALGEELKRSQDALKSFARIELVELLDREATKVNLLAALKRFAGETGELPVGAPEMLNRIQKAQPEDALAIFFAGHGTAASDRFYLLPHDLGYTGGISGLDQAGLKTILAHGISDRELEQAFEGIDAGRMVLVIDACNSGQALDAEEKRRGPMNSKGLAQLAYEKGLYVLTAAQAFQVALEATQLGHGFLTFALVEEGLKTLAADKSPKDGSVTLREWLDYAVARVPEIHMEMIGERKSASRAITIVPTGQELSQAKQRSVQRPRVFYRREPDIEPFVVAKPERTP